MEEATAVSNNNNLEPTNDIQIENFTNKLERKILFKSSLSNICAAKKNLWSFGELLF